MIKDELQNCLEVLVRQTPFKLHKSGEVCLFGLSTSDKPSWVAYLTHEDARYEFVVPCNLESFEELKTIVANAATIFRHHLTDRGLL